MSAHAYASLRGKRTGLAGMWPERRSFALSIVDDTDNATLANIAPLYSALQSHGILSTKTVWSLPSVPGDPYEGDCLLNDDYLHWIQGLAQEGFEIAWHGTRSGGATRDLVVEGIDIFRDRLGDWPATYVNHAQNVENVYWGEQRFDNAVIRMLYKALRPARATFAGSNPQTPHYWGDVCRRVIRYVRGFTFGDIVTTDADQWMPYYDPRRPDVRAWFSGSEAPDADTFIELLRPSNLDRLQRSGGACVIYTHFARGFVRHGMVDERVAAVLDDLCRRDGWFVPVKTLLEHIEGLRGVHQLKPAERRRLEMHWAFDHLGLVLRR